MLWIKKAYFYVAALISLVVMIIGAVQILNLVLRTYVFTKADKAYYYSEPVVCPESRDGQPVKCSPREMTDEEKRRQEEQRQADKQREASNAIAMLVVGAPVFYFHLKYARKD